MSGFALLFPGQGAQRVGMGRTLAEGHTAARAAFEEGDRILGYGLSRLCFEGPAERLDETRHAQPALYVCGAAALRALEASGVPVGRAVASAGLSLGEYTALHFAGALDFADGLRLVAARGEAMQAACAARRGSMASVLGLTRDIVQKTLVGHEAWITNVNAPDQIVVGGGVDALAPALEALRGAGARRIVPLQVVGAYHTPLMEPALAPLRRALSTVRIGAPRVPVWSNVTGAPGDAASIADLLVRQVTAPVLWGPIVEGMLRQGIRRFVEVGCGNVLAGLLRRLDRDAECAVVQEGADVAAAGALVRG